MKNYLYKILKICFVIAFLYILAINNDAFLGFGKKADNLGETNQSQSLFAIEDIKQLFKDADSYKTLSENKAEVFNKNKEKLGVVLHTFPDCSELKGFAGAIPLLIAYDNQDKNLGVSILKNKETPGFLQRIVSTGLLDKWKGLGLSETIEAKVDAVSGATMSSSCIINSVKKRVANHAALAVKESEQQTKAFWQEVAAWFCLILAMLAYLPKSPLMKYRKLGLCVSVLIPGFMLGRFFSIGLLQSWAIDGIPFSQQLFMCVLVAEAIFLPIFFGKSFYCVHYCPFGAAQELCGHLIKYKYTPNGKWAKVLSKCRPTFLVVIILLILFNATIDLYLFEPFTAFIFKSASNVTLILAIVFLLLSIFVRKPWCNYFCPSGQFLESCRAPKIK